MRKLNGGCRCGAIRYRLDSRPFDCGWCHCRTCQLSSGAPAMAFASVEHGGWVVTQGRADVRRMRSSSFAERLSCARCGTPLGIDYAMQPETFDFTVATLDEPARSSPVFTSSGRARSPGSIRATICRGTTGFGRAPLAWRARCRPNKSSPRFRGAELGA